MRRLSRGAAAGEQVHRGAGEAFLARRIEIRSDPHHHIDRHERQRAVGDEIGDHAVLELDPVFGRARWLVGERAVLELIRMRHDAAVGGVGRNRHGERADEQRRRSDTDAILHDAAPQFLSVVGEAAAGPPAFSSSRRFAILTFMYSIAGFASGGTIDAI